LRIISVTPPASQIFVDELCEVCLRQLVWGRGLVLELIGGLDGDESWAGDQAVRLRRRDPALGLSAEAMAAVCLTQIKAISDEMSES